MMLRLLRRPRPNNKGRWTLPPAVSTGLIV